MKAGPQAALAAAAHLQMTPVPASLPPCTACGPDCAAGCRSSSAQRAPSQPMWCSWWPSPEAAYQRAQLPRALLHGVAATGAEAQTPQAPPQRPQPAVLKTAAAAHPALNLLRWLWQQALRAPGDQTAAAAAAGRHRLAARVVEAADHWRPQASHKAAPAAAAAAPALSAAPREEEGGRWDPLPQPQTWGNVQCCGRWCGRCCSAPHHRPLWCDPLCGTCGSSLQDRRTKHTMCVQAAN